MPKLKRLKHGAHFCAVKFNGGAKCKVRVAHAGDLCARHAKTPATVVTGRFSSIKRQSIRERLAAVQRFETDAMDLLPEIELVRALVIDFVDNYDDFVEGIKRWNATLEPGERPQAIPKLDELTKLMSTIAQLAGRHHDIQNRGSISIEDFHRAISHMGAAVALYVTDKQAQRNIEEAWGNIALDAKHPLTRRQKRLNAPVMEGELVHGDRDAS